MALRYNNDANATVWNSEARSLAPILGEHCDGGSEEDGLGSSLFCSYCMDRMMNFEHAGIEL